MSQIYFRVETYSSLTRVRLLHSATKSTYDSLDLIRPRRMESFVECSIFYVNE